MAGFQINEPAVSDVIRALVHVLGHEADVRVSRAASTHHYGFSLPDVLRQRIDALLCEGQVEASGQGIAQSDRKVEINMPRITGEVRVSGSTAESCSNFGSLIADTPVCKRGKWMYEVTLGTAGIMQLGWATAGCQFSNEEGVGDSVDSYAYDGKRVQRWNISCLSYGQEWARGDIIGVMIDLDMGTISFMRNGVSLGQAFSHIHRLEYYPSASLSYGEKCEFNFGGQPLAHPVVGYRAIQRPPPDTKAAAWLLGAFKRLIASAVSCGWGLSQDTAWVVLCEAGLLRQTLQVFVSHLRPMLAKEYNVHGAFVPFLQSLADEPSLASAHAVHMAVALLSMHLNGCEARKLWMVVLESLSWHCRTTSCLQADRDQGSLTRRLDLVMALLQIDTVRDIWLAAPEWKPAFEGFFTIKAHTAVELAQHVPVIHFPEAERVSMPDSVDKERYKKASKALRATMAALYDRHSALARLLLDAPVAATWSQMEPAKQLTEFLVYLVRKNKGADRNIPPPGLSDPSVMTSAFFLLLSLLQPYMEGRPGHEGSLSSFPAGAMFLGGTTSGRLDTYYGAGRLGGAPGHLMKTVIPKAEDAAASVSVKPVQDTALEAAAASRAAGALVSFHHGNLSFGSASSGCSSQSTHSGTLQQQRQQQGPQPGGDEHVASSPCGPFPHSDSALRDPHAAHPAQPMRLQHAWSAPGALQDNSISLSPSTPARPQHALHQMPQEHMDADMPDRSLGPYPAPEHSMLRYPAPETPGAAPRSQPMAAPQEVSMQSPQAWGSAGPSTQPLTWAAPFGAHAGQRYGAPPTTPTLSSSAALSPAPTRSSHQPTMPFAASPALQDPGAPPRAPQPPWARKLPHSPSVGRLFSTGQAGRPPSEDLRTPSPSMSPHRQTQDWSGSRGVAAGEGQATTAAPPALSAREASCLCDTLVRLYHLGMVGAFRHVAYHQQSGTQALQHYDELQQRLPAVEDDPEELSKWTRAMKRCQQTLADSARFAAWHNACLLSEEDVQGILVMCTYLTRLLAQLSGNRTLFSYVPEMYLEAVLDGFNAVRARPHVSRTPAFRVCADSLVPFLACHFREACIASPDMREMLLQTISILLQSKPFVARFEASSDARAHLIGGLLEAFQGREWVPVSSILARLTSSSAFGASAARVAGSSSVIFQASLEHMIEAHHALAEGFLNRLFALLNWTLTEFTISSQELGDTTPFLNSNEPGLKRRCIVMLELSATLARVLEFLTSRLPDVFLAGPPLNLSRVAETVCFVVAHLTAKSTSGQAVIRILSTRFPESQNVKSAVLLTPMLGMLLNLQSRYRSGRPQSPQGADLLEALHVAGLGSHTACFSAAAVRELQAAEFPVDALWTDRIAELDVLASALRARAQHKAQRSSSMSSSDEDVPEEFVDPIMMTPMSDPVVLPDSKATIDRSTAIRHLLASPTDPFTRTPLSLEDLHEDMALRMRIASWRSKMT